MRNFSAEVVVIFPFMGVKFVEILFPSIARACNCYLVDSLSLGWVSSHNASWTMTAARSNRLLGTPALLYVDERAAAAIPNGVIFPCGPHLAYIVKTICYVFGLAPRLSTT